MNPTDPLPMDPALARLAESVSVAHTLEDLARPLLEMLEAATGLESTYLTTVSLERGLQHILFAHNARELAIPEGADVPWQQTLCRRALEEGCSFTDDVPGRWGDSGAARALGIRTYVSTPIRLGDGVLYGTLCGASTLQRALPPKTEHLLQLFAKLIGQHVERERLIGQLQRVNAELAATSLTDPLTGLPNRRGLMAELKRALSRGARGRTAVMVGFIDFDDFKRINDEYGHDIGDAFLAAMAKRIGDALRASDFLARLGGDEFVVVGPGPLLTGDVPSATAGFGKRIADATVARLELDGIVIDYEGASVGAVAVDAQGTTSEDAVKMADAAMYTVKRARARDKAARARAAP